MKHIEETTAPWPGVQSIERTVAIVRAVAERHRQGARLIEVMRATGLTKSTAHRILQALVRAGWLEQSGRSGRFHLGLELCALGSAAVPRHELVELGQRAAAQLAADVGDTVYFQVRAGFESICAARCEGSFPVRILMLEVGQRRPLGIGAGSIALLAALPDAECERAIAANLEAIQAFAPVNAEALRALVRETRARGYAFAESVFVPGVSAVGMAIPGPDGLPTAALSVATLNGRLQEARREEVAGVLRQAARAVAAEFCTPGTPGRLAAARAGPDPARTRTPPAPTTIAAEGRSE